MVIKLSQSDSGRLKLIIVSYFMLCLLSYGLGALILDNFHANAVGNAIVIISGLLIIITCPGLLCSLSLFDRKYTITEHIVIGFGINLFIIPSILVLANIAGIQVGIGLVASVIALLTLFSAVIWIGRNRSNPSISEVKSTLLQLSSVVFCLFIVVLIYPREILTQIDQYGSDDSLIEIVEGLTGQNKIESTASVVIERRELNILAYPALQNVPWKYTNSTSGLQQFITSLLTNCGQLQLLYSPSNPAGPQSPSEKTLKIDELRVSSSKYLPLPEVDLVFIDTEFPNRNRVYVSEKFTLSPGENSLNIRCLESKDQLRIFDLSVMNRLQLMNSLSKNYLFKAEPEVGDAQEAFLESKYALDAISWINPPLLYPIYRGAFVILGASIGSIALLELFTFSLVFMMLCLIAAEAKELLPIKHSMMALIVVVNYAIAMTMLPVLHSAASVFLLMFLAGSWFLWRRQFVPAVGAFIVMCMMRYEGVILAVLSLFAFAALADYQIRIRVRVYILSGLAAVGVVSFLVAWLWGAKVLQPEALVERIQMMGLTDIGAVRILDYVQWALVLASGIPIFWIFIEKKDRLSAYYLLIAVLYLGFLCSLDYVRPYHLGPFVFAAAAAGMRAIVSVGDATIRKMVVIVFFVLAFGSSYLVLYHLPRQLHWPIPQSDTSS